MIPPQSSLTCCQVLSIFVTPASLAATPNNSPKGTITSSMGELSRKPRQKGEPLVGAGPGLLGEASLGRGDVVTSKGSF